MRLNKKNLKRWIQVSIEVSILTSNPGIDVDTGRALLLCPSEVIDVLRRKKVLLLLNEKFYFEYQGRFGITFVEVRKDPKDRTGLYLESSHNG